MTILIVFATNSGGTQIAAHVVSDTLTSLGYSVTVQEARQTTIDTFSSYDAIILGSPSWDFDDKEGQPHEDFIKLIEDGKQHTTPGKRIAIFGLGDSSYQIFCGAVDHLVEFVTSLQGTLVGDPLKIDGFYYNQEKNTQLLTQWATSLHEFLDAKKP